MAASSNPHDSSERIQDLKYLYASNTNVSNFVSVKLSSDQDYHLWKTQMLCLMKSHNMGGIVDDAYVSPRTSSKEIMDQYDSLLKGWIFGSISKNVLGAVVDLASAKDVWDRLKSFYDVNITHQQAPTELVVETEVEAKAEGETETETKAADEISAETNTNGEEAITIDVVSTKTETEVEAAEKEAAYKKKIEDKKKLREATIEGGWSVVESLLKEDKDLVREIISSDGSKILHIAVGIGHNDFVKSLLIYITEKDVLAKRNSDGSTALHIAAIVGNTYAAELLVKKNKLLLREKDQKDQEPLHKAYENMHLDTIVYLLKAVDDDGESMSRSFPIDSSVRPHLHPGANLGVELLVNAISAKQYNLASQLIERFPTFASKNDDVLMAIAKSFPSGDYDETWIIPSWKQFWKEVYDLFASIPLEHFKDTWGHPKSVAEMILPAIDLVVLTVLLMIIYLLYGLLVLLAMLYTLWQMSTVLVEPITHMRKKKKQMDEAEKVLELICGEIDKLKFTGSHHPYYTRPILEAACQNAHKVVDEILYRSPEAILSRDKSGYDIIQLAVIHRSERIYNLMYDIGERKNLYRTTLDSSDNNILHLAGRLAPSHELSQRTGAALQLQRELQWREEVKKVVFPTYITQENIFKETPDMVFTREHKNLVKEGEQWMKTTAESCSITAALITTIVFAAAITVPGGSNQNSGIPVFTKDVAFIIFAVSDAISLFSSSTALLVFLSILTARFSEKDFLVSLPRRLLIGICALVLSAISMMVAFGATLFLVFCHKKLWLLAPIVGLSLIPISFFVALQLPLIVDLFQSTYFRIFGPRRRGKRVRFNPDSIRLFFGK